MSRAERKAAIIEDAAWIAETGGDHDEAARRIGIRSSTLYDLLLKAGRNDINKRLRANAPDPHVMRGHSSYVS